MLLHDCNQQFVQVMVFDLGGGTYDISMLEVGNGTIEVLSNGGDPHLGGDDWDAAIMDWLATNYLGSPNITNSSKGGSRRPKTSVASKAEKVDAAAPKGAASGVDLGDPKFIANLRALAEAAKRGLTSAEEVSLR